MVIVIWQQAASPPHTDCSVVFVRLCQCAPHLIGLHASLRPPESKSQTASRLVQPFFAGLTTVTDRPTDRETRSVTIGRIYILSTAMRPNNSSNAWFIVSTYDVISDLQRRTLMPERVMTRLSARLSSFVCSSLYSVKRLDALSSLHVMGLGSLVFSRDRTVVTLQ